MGWFISLVGGLHVLGTIMALGISVWPSQHQAQVKERHGVTGLGCEQGRDCHRESSLSWLYEGGGVV